MHCTYLFLLGASYDISVASTNRVAEGSQATAALINADSADEITFASSSTQAAENLARAIENDFLDDEEIIVTGEHEGGLLLLLNPCMEIS